MRNSLTWRFALAAITMFSGMALANPPADMPMHDGKMGHGMGHGMGGGWYGSDDHYERMFSAHGLSALNLSDDQRKKLMDLRRELRDKTWDLQKQAIDQREQLGLLYSAESLDISAIKGAYEKLFQVKLKLIEHTLKFKQDLEKILNQDQREQFRKMMMRGPMHGYKHGKKGDMSDSNDKD